MTTIIFLIVSFLIVLIQYKREKNLINLISSLVMPYFFIVLLNNYFFYRLDFYKISDRVLWMILTSFIAFFLGSCIASFSGMPVIFEKDNEERYKKYRIKAMTNCLILIGIIGLIKVTHLFLSGQFFGDRFVEAEGIMGNGWVGHLLLFSYSILPIVFLYWLDHKNEIKCLIATIFIVGVTFTSFVKYHVIGVVVSLVIFTNIYKKSLQKKSLIIMLLMVIVIFVGNYSLGFYFRDTSASSSFYIKHFWVYASGSSIYDDYIFDPGINTHIAVEYKMMTFLMALPNMFIKKIFGGDGLFPHTGKNFLPVGTNGKLSNVVDAFGYLFPARGTTDEIVSYYMIIFFLGFLFNHAYIKGKRKSLFFNTFIANLITYFVFFSFFGTFYVFAGPWEILTYSLLIPSLFLKSPNARKEIVHSL